MDTDGNISSLSEAVTQLNLLNTSAEGGSGVLGLALLFVIFIGLSAFFSCTECGLSVVNKIRIRAKADDGDKRAKSAMSVISDFDRALTTLLIGNNIANITIASISTVIFTRLFGASDRVTLVCTVFTTVVVFIFGEIIPKSFAGDRSESVALFTSPIMRGLMKILFPLTALFTWISSGITKLLSGFFRHEEEPSITEEELYDIIETIEEEGVIDEEQGEMIKSALDFSGTRARDVMTMRDDINYIDVRLSASEILDIVRESVHSRLPVCDGDPDRILGVLQIRTFMRAYLKNPNVDVRTLMLPAYRVAPTALIDDLLSEMRLHKFYLGIVADEDGKTLGIVTIEDFLEELVGEIWDEEDVVDKNFVKLGGGRVRVAVHMTLGEICDRAGFTLPDMAFAARPLLSVILERFGRVPEEDESFLLGKLEVTVSSIQDGRIEEAELCTVSDEENEEATDESDSEKPDGVSSEAKEGTK